MIKQLAGTLLLLSIVTNASAAEMILPEVSTEVAVSNHDINRIVCPGQMNDLIFSKEKGLIGHFSGNSAFIKFKVEDDGGEYTYASEPCELFAVCDNVVYSLIVIPKDIPSVTRRLASPKGKSFKKNIAHYKNMPLEKQALQIIREAYNESYPTSYRIAESKKEVPLSPNFTTTLVQAVDVDGVGLRMKKFQVTSRAIKRIQVEEQDFLSPAVSDSILAVAVEDHSLKPGESTRVFVVEKKERD
ncbi:MAG TPA: hypothetical protein ENJ30_14250 [Desulfobulbaceae bacterium]|nr:hypothetical protein [Desulfobulbaceae bacterium]